MRVLVLLVHACPLSPHSLLCICFVLQLLKVYALARVTPTAVRQLLTLMGLHTSVPATAAPPASSPAAAKASTKPAAAPADSKAAQPVAPSPRETGVVAVVEPGSMPPDEVLSGSNIYSTAEASLLAWMNAHFVKAFPKLVSHYHGVMKSLALILTANSQSSLNCQHFCIRAFCSADTAS